MVFISLLVRTILTQPRLVLCLYVFCRKLLSRYILAR